jgi:hypothetical protein
MMFLASGDGEGLDKRRRLFVALVSLIWTRSSRAAGHTVRQIRNGIDELSNPPRNDEVLFAETEDEKENTVSDGFVWKWSIMTRTPTLSSQYARRKRASVELSGTESRKSSWPDLVVGNRQAKRLVRGHVRSQIAG